MFMSTLLLLLRVGRWVLLFVCVFGGARSSTTTQTLEAPFLLQLVPAFEQSALAHIAEDDDEERGNENGGEELWVYMRMCVCV